MPGVITSEQPAATTNATSIGKRSGKAIPYRPRIVDRTASSHEKSPRSTTWGYPRFLASPDTHVLVARVGPRYCTPVLKYISKMMLRVAEQELVFPEERCEVAIEVEKEVVHI